MGERLRVAFATRLDHLGHHWQLVRRQNDEWQAKESRQGQAIDLLINAYYRHCAPLFIHLAIPWF